MHECLEAMRAVLDSPDRLGQAVFNLLPSSDAQGPYLLVEHGERFETRQTSILRVWAAFRAWAPSPSGNVREETPPVSASRATSHAP
jgi:hypothetical protein